MTGLAGSVPDPTALLIVDEADRLKMAGLEQIRSIFDQGRIGLILIGMPGLEKRLARYPQFYLVVGGQQASARKASRRVIVVGEMPPIWCVAVTGGFPVTAAKRERPAPQNV
jgi:hypothetical protein